MRRGARLTRPRDVATKPWRDRWTPAPVLNRPTTFVREPETPLTMRELVRAYPHIVGWRAYRPMPVCVGCGAPSKGSLLIEIEARAGEYRAACWECGTRAKAERDVLMALVDRKALAAA